MQTRSIPDKKQFSQEVSRALAGSGKYAAAIRFERRIGRITRKILPAWRRTPQCTRYFLRLK